MSGEMVLNNDVALKPLSNFSKPLKMHFFFLSFVFLGPHPWHVDIPRLGVELELQMLAYATATEMQDLSHV